MEPIARPRPEAPASARAYLLLLTAVTAISLAGCPAHHGAAAVSPARISPEMPPAKAAAGVEDRIKADPIAYLKDVYARVNALQAYRLTFYRQERTGIIPKLGQEEQISALYRKQPFSVKFRWDDPGSEYVESVYVQGENNNKLVVLPRKGLLGMPARPLYIDVMTPVQFGKSKNPITDFGLAELTARTLAPFNDADIAAVMTIKYQGLVNLDPSGRPAYFLLIERPVMKDIRYTRQEFYIDTGTQLPAGTDLFLPSGDLDVKYRYTDVDTTAHPTDADFRLTGR